MFVLSSQGSRADQRFKNVHFQHSSILPGLGQPLSHMCMITLLIQQLSKVFEFKGNTEYGESLRVKNSLPKWLQVGEIFEVGFFSYEKIYCLDSLNRLEVWPIFEWQLRLLHKFNVVSYSLHLFWAFCTVIKSTSMLISTSSCIARCACMLLFSWCMCLCDTGCSPSFATIYCMSW